MIKDGKGNCKDAGGNPCTSHGVCCCATTSACTYADRRPTPASRAGPRPPIPTRATSTVTRRFAWRERREGRFRVGPGAGALAGGGVWRIAALQYTVSWGLPQRDLVAKRRMLCPYPTSQARQLSAGTIILFSAGRRCMPRRYNRASCAAQGGRQWRRGSAAAACAPCSCPAGGPPLPVLAAATHARSHAIP